MNTATGGVPVSEVEKPDKTKPDVDLTFLGWLRRHLAPGAMQSYNGLKAEANNAFPGLSKGCIQNYLDALAVAGDEFEIEKTRVGDAEYRMYCRRAGAGGRSA